jgi:hypothetical protein
MGFILRSVFWLGLASIIVPAQMRLGGDSHATDGREATLNEQIHDTAYAMWGFASEVVKTCDSNPAFCDAGKNLITTVTDTGASLLHEAQTHFAGPANMHVADASPQRAQQHRKFQDRIE